MLIIYAVDWGKTKKIAAVFMVGKKAKLSIFDDIGNFLGIVRSSDFKKIKPSNGQEYYNAVKNMLDYSTRFAYSEDLDDVAFEETTKAWSKSAVAASIAARKKKREAKVPAKTSSKVEDLANEAERLSKLKVVSGKRLDKVGVVPGINYWATKQVVMEDGTKAMEKEYGSVDGKNSELGAFELSNEMGFGFVSPAWTKPGERIGYQKWADGKVGMEFVDHNTKGLELKEGSGVSKDKIAELDFFDYMIGNWDRRVNPGNWLWDGENVVAIDNDGAFTKHFVTKEGRQNLARNLRGMSPDGFSGLKKKVNKWNTNKIDKIIDKYNLVSDFKVQISNARNTVMESNSYSEVLTKLRSY